MKGRSAHRFKADCYAREVYVCEPFRTCSIHITHFPNGVYFDNIFNNNEWHDIGSCSNHPFPPHVPRSGKFQAALLRGPNALPYGFTKSDITMRLGDVRVKSEDLAAWRPRHWVTSGDPNIWSRLWVSGPAVKYSQACYGLQRRSRMDDQYENDSHLHWYYTDPDEKLDYCCHKDWLGSTYPANWIWHNYGVKQPFLSWKYWEDCGVSPNTTTPNETGMNFIEFCDPLPVYDVSGTEKLGDYIGYTHMFFVNNNIFMCGNDKWSLPLDPWKSYDQFMSRDQHVLSLDVHFYLLARPLEGKVLKSPRIGSFRYWRGNQATGNEWTKRGQSSCKPYLFLVAGEMEFNFWLNVEYLLTDGTTEVIPHGLSNPRAYLVA